MTKEKLFAIGLLILGLIVACTAGAHTTADTAVVETVSEEITVASSVSIAPAMVAVEEVAKSAAPVESISNTGQAEIFSEDGPDAAASVDIGAQATDEAPDAVSPKEVAAAPKTLDPVLLEIKRQLKMLVKAQLPSKVNVQQLFDVPLDDIDKVERRIQQLKLERGTLRSSREDKENRRKSLTVEFPAPKKPELLKNLPVAPTQPEGPTAPLRPEMKRPRGKLTPKRPQIWLDANAAWQGYDEALVQHQEALARYEQQMVEHTAALAAHENELLTWNDAQEAFDNSLRQRKNKIAIFDAELRLDMETIGLRSRILSLRLKYLDSLHRWLKPMTAPARTALRELKLTRELLVNTIDGARQLRASLTALSVRLKTVANRAEAGSLVGYELKLSQLAADLRLLADSVQQRGRKIQSEQRTLQNLRVELRTNSGDVRRLILANVFHPKRDKLIDAAFLTNLGDMRKAAKSWFMREIDLTRSARLHADISGTAKYPEKIASGAEGTALVKQIRPLLEKLDVHADELSLFKEHQKQVFRREAVSVLSTLATEKTKKTAYSFSQEIWADISSDAHTLVDTLRRWLNERKAAVLQIPDMVRARQGIVFLVRILAAITLLILTGLLGRKLSRLVSLAIRRFSRARFFRHRLGQLVKWAGVAESILPTVLVGGTLYAALAVIGFDVPEVKFVEVILRWLLLYKFGGQLLGGLTKRVSRGRPAFIPVSTDVAKMLSGTYNKLGLVVALAAVVLEWTTNWFGSGILHSLVVYTLWGWLFVWGLWVFFIWRSVVATSLLARYMGNGTRPVDRLKSAIGRVGEWMTVHRFGAIFTAPALILLLLDWLYRKVRYLLYEGGIVAFFRARLIRRLVNTQKKNSNMPAPRSLPEQYTRSFPLYPIYDEEDAVILPRKNSVDNIVQQIERWRITKQDSSLVLLGEKGIGKTTLLTLLEQQLSGNVLRYSISQKLKSEKALVNEFATMLEIEECAPVVGSLASVLNKGEERVILVDEGHNVFLRTIDGYDAYESLIRLVNVTSQNVFWVLVFNTFSFAFLNTSRNRLHYFRKLHYLPTWSRDDLLDLISKRNSQTGFEVEFDEMLLDANRSSSGDFEVIEGAEGFFRLLWENSGGNPRVATCLWLDALTAIGDQKIKVGIFSESLATELSKMDKELLYTLSALLQHENLSVAELREVLNVSIDFANFAIRFLTEYGLVTPKHTDVRRHTLAARFYPQVIKMLRSHHLLYEMA